MTREHARKVAQILNDWADGKQIQKEVFGYAWKDYTFDEWGQSNYRLKPTPTLRPWKPEEVPIGALIHRPGYWDTASTILCVDSKGNLCYSSFTTGSILTVQEALEKAKYSLDIHKPVAERVWHPCGVVE